MGFIGDDPKEYEFEPFPATEPRREETPQPAPVAPEPKREEVPA